MDPNLVRYFVPEISANPSAVSIIQGTGTTLSVQATGKFLSYQWQKNGVDITGQNTSSLSLSNSSVGDDANYSVVISNDWGSVTSPLARVTVATTLPTITILGSATFLHEAATPYTDAGATAVDALGGDLTSSISITSADINVTDVGNQDVTYSVTDAGGNTNTATRTVTVQDNTAPSLTLIGDSNFTHNLNTAWVDPGYDAQDSLDGNLTSSVSITGSVDVNSTGTYTLNYSVSDTTGNQADINRTVNVAPMGPWTFTNAVATGRFGPTQAQIDANYSGTSLEGAVTINATHQGIQEWTVPASGTYRIEVSGSQGGDEITNPGGLGAKLSGNFNLQKNSVISILVGQRSGELPSSSPRRSAGGGGGSFVVLNSNLLIAAGGGGGASSLIQNGINGSYLQNGLNGGDGSGLGGTNGDGGMQGSSSGGAGGAGWNSGGQNGSSYDANNENFHITGGITFMNGGAGGNRYFADQSNHGSVGGFGGGGGGWAGGGGGGGYSGGGSGRWVGDTISSPGGGGGSYNSGTDQNNQSGVNEGHGKVLISYIGN
jgi:hypothetical protein